MIPSTALADRLANILSTAPNIPFLLLIFAFLLIIAFLLALAFRSILWHAANPQPEEQKPESRSR